MYWPYRIPVREAAKRAVIVMLGCMAGSYAVRSYYQPLKGFDERLEKGKLELLRKYRLEAQKNLVAADRNER